MIPPMQSLEDVLMMALKGADPYAVEALLRKRGDSHRRPRTLASTSRSRGTRQGRDPGRRRRLEYHNTRALEDRLLEHSAVLEGGARSGAIVQHRPEQADLLQRFGEKAQVGEDREARCRDGSPARCRASRAGAGLPRTSGKVAKPT